jgi:hypothetical protein
VNPVLADSSFFVALYNRREIAHLRCVEAYRALDAALVTCEACITEALHILGHADAAVDSIFASIEEGSLEVPFHLGHDVSGVRGLICKYRDTPADFADACLISLADQLGTGDILTLDSDFKHYRWRRNRRFRILISMD